MSMTEGEKLIWAAAFAQTPVRVEFNGVETAAQRAFNVVLAARAKRNACKDYLEPFAYEMFCEVMGYVEDETEDCDE